MAKTAVKYKRVKRALLERIASRQYTEKKAVPPEAVLAKEFRVAPMTARRAIQELVAEGLLVRLPGRGKGTFVRRGHLSAAPNGSGGPALRRLSVAYCHGGRAIQTNPVHFLIFLELQAACAREGIGLTFLPVDGEATAEAILKEMRGSDGQALVVLDWPQPEVLLKVQEAGVPVIVTDATLAHMPLNYVVANDYQGAYAVTMHLRSLGHERVGIVNARWQSKVSLDRHAGWRSAMGAAAGDPSLEFLYDTSSRGEASEEAAMQADLLSQFRRAADAMPTALFARDGLTAHAAMAALQEMGLTCPQDVSVACIGRSFEQVPGMRPMTKALTADAALPRRVLRLADDLLTGRESEPVGILLPMRIVEGDTTAPPRPVVGFVEERADI